MELGIDIEQGRAELRQQIRFYLDRKGLNQKQLVKQLGWSDSRFSQMMNADSFGVEHLDMLAKTFDLPEGAFYRYMLTELFASGGSFRTANAIQFVKRCLDTNKRELIMPVLHHMLNRRHTREALFNLAENCFAAGYREEILALYELQISDELNRFSERVAVSYFRRFLILRDRGIESGLAALHQMLMYVSYLPHEINLDAHLRIITFHYARNDWDNVLEYARSLEHIAKKGEYYGKALLYQSFAYRETGQFQQALELTDRYAKIEGFSEHARGNRPFILLKSGDLSVVPELLRFSEEKGTVSRDLATVLEAYVRAGLLEEAERLLQVYQTDIVRLKQDESQFMKKFRLRFSIFYAKYSFQTDKIDCGLRELLEAVRLADWLNDQESVRRCTALFLANYDHAQPEQRTAFQNILNGGVTHEMVGNDHDGHKPVDV